MARWPKGHAVPQVRKRRHHPLVAALPFRWRFYRSGLYISPLAPIILGALVGVLTMLMGVGGGFLITPLLIFYNIPPVVAVATGANQVVASSVSGAISHFRRGTLLG